MQCNYLKFQTEQQRPGGILKSCYIFKWADEHINGGSEDIRSLQI